MRCLRPLPVTIKDILGHAHLKTLEVYVQADLEMKRKAIEETPSPVESGPAVLRHEPDLPGWMGVSVGVYLVGVSARGGPASGWDPFPVYGGDAALPVCLYKR